MATNRWDPFREAMTLNSAMESLLRDAFVPTRAGSAQLHSIAWDVAEDAEAFWVYATVPGVHPDQLDLIVNEQSLTIRGEVPAPALPEGAQVRLQEWGAQRFERSLQFPVPLNADTVQASYDQGILTLYLPKAEAAKPRRITIQNQPKQIEARVTTSHNGH
jgi:HSP20 family protein